MAADQPGSAANGVYIPANEQNVNNRARTARFKGDEIRMCGPLPSHIANSYYDNRAKAEDEGVGCCLTVLQCLPRIRVEGARAATKI